LHRFDRAQRTRTGDRKIDGGGVQENRKSHSRVTPLSLPLSQPHTRHTMAAATDDAALRETRELAGAVEKLSSKVQPQRAEQKEGSEHKPKKHHGGWSESTPKQKQRAKEILQDVPKNTDQLQYIGLASTLFASAVYSTFAAQAMLFISGRKPGECRDLFAAATDDADVPGCTGLARAAQATFLFFNQITFGGAVLIFLMTALAHCPDNGPFQDERPEAWAFLSVMGLSYIAGFTVTSGCIAFICAGYAIVPPSLFPIVHVGTACTSVTVLLTCFRWRWLMAQLYTTDIQDDIEHVYEDFSRAGSKWNKVREGVAFHCRYTMVFVNNLLWTAELLVVTPLSVVLAASGWSVHKLARLSRAVVARNWGEDTANRYFAPPPARKTASSAQVASSAQAQHTTVVVDGE
jgi:hypothetical protein